MGVDDVISIAKTNEYLASVATEYLNYRFFKKLLIFDVTKREFNPEIHSQDDDRFMAHILEEDHSIKFRNANHLIKYVLNLGVKIRKLKILDCSVFLSHPFDDEVGNIFKRIKQQHSDDLVELHVTGLKSFIDGIDTPFNNVSAFSWITNGRIWDDEIIMDVAKFYKNFPVLRFLELTNEPVSNTTFEIPSMEYFKVSVADKKIINFLKANQKLKTLILGKSEPEVLKFIADEMPNLKNLRFEFFDYFGNFSVKFNHLKSIMIDSHKPGIIKFGDKLEEFVSTFFPTEDWIQFLTNNSNIKLVKIDQFMYHYQILELTSIKIGVNELNVSISGTVVPKLIIQLIESCAHLDIFTFKIGTKYFPIYYEEWDQKRLLIDHFNDWTLTKNGVEYSLIKNKNRSNQ